MEQIEPLLRELAAQLGTTVQYLWQVLINQAHVYVISYILWWVLALILIYLAILTSRWFMRMIEKNENDENAMAAFMIAIIQWVVIVILVVGNILTTETFLSALLNPEYWALQQILEFIK